MKVKLEIVVINMVNDRTNRKCVILPSLHTVVHHLAIESKVMHQLHQHTSTLCVVEVANKSIQSIWNDW